MKMHMDKEHMDKEHMLKKVWSQYTACANVYLAPTYSDCMDQMDDLLEGSVEEWRSAAGKAKNDQLQGCLLLKQSNYWWKVWKIKLFGEIQELYNFRIVLMLLEKGLKA